MKSIVGILKVQKLLFWHLRFWIFQKRKFTVWIFHDFSITQILREINFWDPRSFKSAIFCPFGQFQLPKRAKIHNIRIYNLCQNGRFQSWKLTKIEIQSLQISKNAFLRLWDLKNWFHVKSEWQKNDTVLPNTTWILIGKTWNVLCASSCKICWVF